MNFDLSFLPETLRAPTVFIIAICLAVGYVARACSFPIKYLQLLVLLTGIAFSIAFISPVTRAWGCGVIYAALSMLSYDMVLSRIEVFLRAKFGTTPPDDLSTPRQSTSTSVITDKTP
jgi:hypothetical protein